MTSADDPITLSATANREHALAENARRARLQHAINSGEALITLEEAVGRGMVFFEWVEQHFDAKPPTAYRYMLLARNKHRIPADTDSISDAVRLLLPDSNPWDPAIGFDRSVREIAHELYDGGSGYRAIARRLGVSIRTVRVWVDPPAITAEKAARKLQRRREKAALRREEARAAARIAGGARNEAYAMAERFQDVIAQAQREAPTREERAAFARAAEHARAMRDDVVRGFGLHPYHEPAPAVRLVTEDKVAS